MIPSRGSGRSEPIWSAYARMLVNGVWRLWLMPRRNSSFAWSSSTSRCRCRSTWSNSSMFRIATATSLAYSSRGPDPRNPSAGRRQVPDQHAHPSSGKREHGADRARLARDVLLNGHHRRVAEDDPGIDHPERRPRAPRRLLDEPFQPVAWATSPRSRAGSARAPGSAARDRTRGGCGSRRVAPARPRPPPRRAPTGRLPALARPPARRPAAARSGCPRERLRTGRRR